MAYRERLHVPLWYWPLGLVFAWSLPVAVWAYLGGAWGLASFVAGTVVVVAALLSMSSAAVVVDADRLRAGAASIEPDFLGEVTVLDASATKRRLGAAADVDAFLLTRPYVSTAVEVRLRDAADPHPYWLISSRHPDELAAAVTRLTTGGTR